jgi:hypothetical protein
MKYGVPHRHVRRWRCSALPAPPVNPADGDLPAPPAVPETAAAGLLQTREDCPSDSIPETLDWMSETWRLKHWEAENIPAGPATNYLQIIEERVSNEEVHQGTEVKLGLKSGGQPQIDAQPVTDAAQMWHMTSLTRELKARLYRQMHQRSRFHYFTTGWIGSHIRFDGICFLAAHQRGPTSLDRSIQHYSHDPVSASRDERCKAKRPTEAIRSGRS